MADTSLTTFQAAKKCEILSLVYDLSLAFLFSHRGSHALCGLGCISICHNPTHHSRPRSNLTTSIRTSPFPPAERKRSIPWSSVAIRELFKYSSRAAFHQTSLSTSPSRTANLGPVHLKEPWEQWKEWGFGACFVPSLLLYILPVAFSFLSFFLSARGSSFVAYKYSHSS